MISTAQTTFQVQGNTPTLPAGASSITLQWPTPQVVMEPGVQVAIWGIAAGSANATVSVAFQNNQTGLWLTQSGNWGVQTFFPAAIVDSARTWRYLYTPNTGGSFTVLAELVGLQQSERSQH